MDIRSHRSPWEVLSTHAPSPLVPLNLGNAVSNSIKVWIKRDDQLCLPTENNNLAFCGNKWRKLKYNLLKAKQLGSAGLITFGGAYSNHIAATAAAGQIFGFRTIGIIRGEENLPLNPTLRMAQEAGMEFRYAKRSAYRKKERAPLVQSILSEFPDYFHIPEGGTNPLALKGGEELAKELIQQLGNPPDLIAVSMGTGGTAAGLVLGSAPASQVLIFPALKGNWPRIEIEALVKNSSVRAEWAIIPDYHFGGFARLTPELTAFIRHFELQHGIPLDPIYTAKLCWGIIQELEKGRWKGPKDLILIHSGGLQGRFGFEERFGISFT